MSEKLLTLKENTNLKEVGQVCEEYQLAVNEIGSEIEKMALMSKALGMVKERLDDGMVKQFKSLENTRLGFQTDKNDGYPVAIVRNCLVQALIQGVKPIGNEFNIIGNNFYVTKEGFTGLMSRNPNFTDLKINQDLPEYDHPNKRASVKYSATWKWQGKEMSTDGVVSIKLQYARSSDYCVTSDDAIYGKAERKIRNRIWNMTTGDNLIEGDTTDLTKEERLERAKPVKATPEDHANDFGIKTDDSVKSNYEWEDV